MTTKEKTKRDELQRELARLQRSLLTSGKSLIIAIDGFESSGKGRLIREIAKQLDPRYFEAPAMVPGSEVNDGYAMLHRFWRALPRYGHITILNRSWYNGLFNEPSLPEAAVNKALKTLHEFEAMLQADGVLVVKLFVNQDRANLEENIKDLSTDPDRAFMVSLQDRLQLKFYDQFNSHMATIREQCAKQGHPWTLIPSSKKKPDSVLALETIVTALRLHLDSTAAPSNREAGINASVADILPLSTVDHAAVVSEKKYRSTIDDLQAEAGDLLYAMYTHKKPAVLVFEGTDAAGKGGAIKRLVAGMDPRGIDIATTAAPDATENQYHYLWRFMRDLPKAGHLTIFDRSWYGRVLVERIEGFATEDRWQAAYEEINAFEHHLVDEGYLVLKFLLLIDKDEQLARFKARELNPDKQFKLTAEDWRNHEQFAAYVDAMNDMVLRTDTKVAPWILIPGKDKLYARVAVLKAFIKYAKTWLGRG